MYVLYGRAHEGDKLLIEATGETNPEMLPLFYSGTWKHPVIERPKSYTMLHFLQLPNPISSCFSDRRISHLSSILSGQFYPEMKLEAEVQPDFVDKLLHDINPRNSNSYIEVWKTQ